MFWDRGKERLVSFCIYYLSNESVFKEKIEVKVCLIYGSSLPRYQDTIRLWFSFVFPSWINNEFDKYVQNIVFALGVKGLFCCSNISRGDFAEDCCQKTCTSLIAKKMSWIVFRLSWKLSSALVSKWTLFKLIFSLLSRFLVKLIGLAFLFSFLFLFGQFVFLSIHLPKNEGPDDQTPPTIPLSKLNKVSVLFPNHV